MDNGQRASNPHDLIVEGITAGSGSIPEGANRIEGEDNLNTQNFANQPTGYSQKGNTALGALDGTENEFELTMPPGEGESIHPLGQIIDLSNPSSGNPPTESNVVTKDPKNSSTNLDPTIAKHLADGKIDKDDVSYLKNKTGELVDNPAELAKFIMRARRTITNRDAEGTKWVKTYLFLYFLQQ